MLKSLTALMLSVGLSQAALASSLVLEPASTTALTSVVDDAAVGQLLMRWNDQFKAGKRRLTLVIDSYGGSVDAGLRLTTGMDILKAKGTNFRCVVTGAAMSMAFFILAKCNDRYTMPFAGLLWHPIRIRYRGVLTTADALALSERLGYYESYFKDYIQISLDADTEYFDQHWFAESVHHGAVLAAKFPRWIQVVDGLAGMPMNEVLWIPNPTPFEPFGGEDDNSAELVWTAPGH